MPKIKLYTNKKPKLRPEILLHSNIPKPLHGLNPRTLKGKEWWDKQRAKAYKKSNYHCIACGVHKTEAAIHQWLEAHECYEIDYKKGTATFTEIVALCHSCHNFIHSGRLDSLFGQWKITRKVYAAIKKHGKAVIKRAKLKPINITSDTVIEWSQWRLIIGKKQYKSKFRSYEEWEEFYLGEE